MAPGDQHIEKVIFSEKAIKQQLQKIFADPLFAVSDILKRFLYFIVQETLEGRSNQLKEYTIGVTVLHKPADFKPQHNGVVRIHAGRLRRALNHYYNSSKEESLIYISIPKGGYVPVFSERFTDADMLTENPGRSFDPAALITQPVTVGVMPFTCFEKAQSAISFTQALAAQLSTQLTQMKNVSVVAYYTMCNMAKNNFDMREIIATAGLQYIFTGGVQFQKKRIRVNIQMTDVNTGEQVCGKLYEKQLTSINVFNIEDEITAQAIFMFENYCSRGKTDISNPSLIAIA